MRRRGRGRGRGRGDFMGGDGVKELGAWGLGGEGEHKIGFPWEMVLYCWFCGFIMVIRSLVLMPVFAWLLAQLGLPF